MRFFNLVIAIYFSNLFCNLHAQTYELDAVNKKDTINFIDNLGKKQGKWVLYGKHKPNQCYAPIQIAETGRYQENRKTGEWLEYFCNGNPKAKVNFINGRQDGLAVLYFENGKVKEEGNWKNNRWVGAYKLYYENGQMQHDFNYSIAGKREGLSNYYHSNGQLAVQGVFKDGKESGLFKEWTDTGKLKAEKSYEGGTVNLASIKWYENAETPSKNEALAMAPAISLKATEKPNEAQALSLPTVLNGQHTLYNKSKQIAKAGLFKDSRLMEGKVYIYDDNGILKRVAVYKKGEYVGDAPTEN